MSTPAIATFDLAKEFGETRALQGLDLQVDEGEIVGCLGPNGAGKTTMIRLLLGLLVPSRGRAEIFGLDTRRQTVAAHRRLAYVPGEANLWPTLSGAETLRLLGQVHGKVDSNYQAKLVERFDLDPTKRVRALSKGNRQKVILIAALMTRADLLILDEPTSGLDPLMERAFRLCIHEAKERGQSVLLSSHILSEVEALCDRIAILRSGALVEMGTMAQLRHLSALTVEASAGTNVTLPSSWVGRTAARGARALRCARTPEPGTFARGALLIALRRTLARSDPWYRRRLAPRSKRPRSRRIPPRRSSCDSRHASPCARASVGVWSSASTSRPRR